MSKWAGIAVAGIWIGIGIISFGPGIMMLKDIAFYGLIATGAVAFLEFYIHIF